MSKVRFTKRWLDSVPPAPAGKRAVYYDEIQPGLAVRVTDRGTKTFCVFRRATGRPVRVSLGKHPEISVPEARTRAAKALVAVTEGRNPNEDRKRAERALRASKSVEAFRAKTLGEVLEDYLQARDLKPATVADYRKVSRSFGPWLARPLVEIGKDDVENLHSKLGKRSPARANYAMRLLRAVFSYAAERYEHDGSPLVVANPVTMLTRTKGWFKVPPRRRKIAETDLPAWYSAVSAYPIEWARDYFLLVLFTGLRRGEAIALKVGDIDLEARTLVIHDPKNRKPHTLPLSDFVEALLRRRIEADRGEFIFPGRGSGAPANPPTRHVAPIIEASGVAFSIHDLRRTFITTAESLDVGAYALKRLLNHSIGGDVTAGYIVHDTERLRGPVQKIADALCRQAKIPARPGRVIQLRRARR